MNVQNTYFYLPGEVHGSILTLALCMPNFPTIIRGGSRRGGGGGGVLGVRSPIWATPELHKEKRHTHVHECATRLSG